MVVGNGAEDDGRELVDSELSPFALDESVVATSAITSATQ